MTTAPRPPDPEAALTLEVTAGLDELRKEWRDLALASGNVFLTWEWATTWWRHYGHRRTPAVTACRDGDGRVVAILPLYLSRRGGLRVLRAIGHGPADELGPVCDPIDRPRALAALLAGLRAGAWPADLLLADLFPAGVLDLGRAWPPGTRTLSYQPAPVIEISGKTFDDYLASWTHKRRSGLKRLERKLLERGLAYRLTTTYTAGRDMQTLFSLHRARWGPRTRFLKDADFHRAFAGVAAREGWLRLWIVSLDGRECAGLHGFRFGDTECHYQGGRLPELERESLGTVALANAIRAACEGGLREYRLLRGDEPYKRHFMTGNRPVVTRAAPVTTVGRLATTLAAFALAQRRRAKRATRSVAGRARGTRPRGTAAG